MKFLIGLLVGVVSGGVSGYIVANKRLKKIYNKELENEISAIKDTQNALAQRKAKKQQEKEAEAEPAKEEQEDDALKTKYSVYHKVDEAKPTVELVGKTEDDEYDYGGEDDDIGEFENDEPPKDSPYAGLTDILKKEGRPYNITAAEFEQRNGFDKASLVYNTSNELFTDSMTGIAIDDGWRDCGGDAGCLDDDRCYEDGFWYVRNERIHTDYQIDICSVV